MLVNRKSYTPEEEKLLLDLKVGYNNKPWNWITEFYNNKVQDPQWYRTEDALVNKHKALKKKEARNQVRMKRIANNRRPKANIPIFTKALPTGQSAVSH